MIEINVTAVLLTILGLLMIVSVLSSRGFERLGVPVVLLFLMVGMLAGSEGIGGLAFNDYRLAFRIGTGALILILLDGGLNTPMAAVKESIKPAGILATVGVALTAGLLAVCSHLLGLSWKESLLLGAVVSSTDAAAVFAVLRGGNLNLIRRVGTTLELESGINDPMAVVLTLAVISVLTGQPVSRMELILGVPLQLFIGLVVGVAAGYATRVLLRRIRLATAGFYPVLTLALAFVAFGVATLANGSGFLAVYAAATVLGNSPIPYRNGLVRVHDAIAWLSQISMFGMFGLLVYPSQLWPIAGLGIGIALLLAFVVRPVAVTLCLLPFRFPAREVGYMGWVGLKGAVPIILATFPVLAGVPEGMKVFNLVFFVVVFSSIIPGATIRPVTRWFGMQAPETPNPMAALEINSTRMLNGELLSFFITDELAVCGAAISQIPFPPTSSAVLLVRGEELVAIRGNTVLQPGDHVYVFCRTEDKPFILVLFGRPQEHA